MNILICNERFLFRFGVDRVLIILGMGLKRLGYSVSFMGNRFDIDILKNISDNIITVPESNPYIESNEFTEKWLKRSWDILFSKGCAPDIAIIGGWPFYTSFSFFKAKGCPVLFNDFGAVPLEGMSGESLLIQQKLRKLRRQFLSNATAIIAESNFIVTSQSKFDTKNSIPIHTILLAADHIDFYIWQKRNLSGNTLSKTLDQINKGREHGVKIILNLGRWETDNYKNSFAIFDIADQLINMGHHIMVLVLSMPEDVQVPFHLKSMIFPVGFPDDSELQEIMKCADIGLSVSLWEGFNLPLAEMQWLGRPVLAFDVGAHKEVVIDKWFLCSNLDEMITKSDLIFNGNYGLTHEEYISAYNGFKDFFTWDRAISQYNDILLNTEGRLLDNNKLNIIVDVTNSAKDPANTGVIRVTRRICRELQNYCNPLFVRWDDECNEYVFPVEVEYNRLSLFNGPVIKDYLPKSTDFGNPLRLSDLNLFQKNIPSWLILTETTMEYRGRHIRTFARSNGMRIAAIFHDAIPVLMPQLCGDSIIRENHAQYMKGLSDCDLIMPYSEFSARCLTEFWQNCGVPGCEVKTNLLSGEFCTAPRAIFSKKREQNTFNILCVSTLEPRKNHYNLIEALHQFSCNHPLVEWQMIFIGNSYAGAFDIAENIESACKKDPRIKWLGVVDDNQLHQAYKNAAITIYPSVIEGFGMPIMESLWHGKPCICHKEGVMAELAKEGGCLTADVTDPSDIADKIASLSINQDLYEKIQEEAMTRHIKTWREYSAEFWRNLCNFTKKFDGSFDSTSGCNCNTNKQNTISSQCWEKTIYKGCITDHWQMNNSERLAVMAFLQRLKPDLAIEVGTYMGGSLSLISQFSKNVFSIDIDPAVAQKFTYFKNVSFLTGSSRIILPLLLAELDRHEMYPEFILIDGDHSKDGVKNDIETILDYVPKKNMFIVMHDSFNPGCRSGMTSAKWHLSPYVHEVEIDFIPGRLVEHGGGGHGELWGGLSLAVLKPEKRGFDLIIRKSSDQMFSILSNNGVSNG